MFQGPASDGDEVFIDEGGAQTLGNGAQCRGGVWVGGDEVDAGGMGQLVVGGKEDVGRGISTR